MVAEGTIGEFVRKRVEVPGTSKAAHRVARTRVCIASLKIHPITEQGKWNTNSTT